jgi:hypothetical protein
MKKAVIGAFVGAIIVFGWQAFSNMVLPHHESQYKQVPDQEKVINTLSQYIKEDGQYLVPRSNAGASAEEENAFQENLKGKPSALIAFHKSHEMNMGVSAFRSFVTAFICVLIFIWLIGRNPGNFVSILLKSIGIGFFAFMLVWYNNNIWLQTPWEVLRAELIDIMVSFTLLGLWLGYFLKNNRKSSKSYGTGFVV